MTVTNRCSVCSKKVKIDYFTCKCDPEAKFCQTHKYPFLHDCAIDSKQQHKEKLQKSNVKVAPQKIELM